MSLLSPICNLADEKSKGGQGARSTEKLSVSLTADERAEIQQRSAQLMVHRRDLKLSRLCRVAFRMMLDSTDEEILQAAAEVENLELRRVK